MAVVTAAVLLGACSDDDDASDTVPFPPPTSSEAPTTTSPSTTVASTTTTPPTSTAAPTTTTSTTTPEQAEEALKAQIAADYVRAYEGAAAMLMNPSLRDLEARAARVAAGERLRAQVDRVRELVELRQKVVPGDPPIRSVVVEAVELGRHTREATVTVCAANNSRVVTVGSGPSGEDEIAPGTERVRAIRRLEPMRLTRRGWLPAARSIETLGRWEGRDSCPPA